MVFLSTVVEARLLKGGDLATGNVVDAKAAIVDELSLWASVANLRYTTEGSISIE
jgi:hypothetical protein